MQNPSPRCRDSVKWMEPRHPCLSSYSGESHLFKTSGAGVMTTSPYLRSQARPWAGGSVILASEIPNPKPYLGFKSCRFKSPCLLTT